MVEFPAGKLLSLVRMPRGQSATPAAGTLCHGRFLDHLPARGPGHRWLHPDDLGPKFSVAKAPMWMAPVMGTPVMELRGVQSRAQGVGGRCPPIIRDAQFPVSQRNRRCVQCGVS